MFWSFDRKATTSYRHVDRPTKNASKTAPAMNATPAITFSSKLAMRRSVPVFIEGNGFHVQVGARGRSAGRSADAQECRSRLARGRCHPAGRPDAPRDRNSR
jgi:hypothetical protein